MEPTEAKRYDPRIDVLRAVAFLLVAVVHFAVTSWTDSIRDRSLVIDTVVLGLIHTGWLGVPLFLFVSGYSLGLGKSDRPYKLDVKQFLINRVLRIFPLWIVCILIMYQFQNFSGNTFLNLLMLQMQDTPPNTAFSLAWTIQLEFVCYFLFPILLQAVANKRNVWTFFAFFALVRILMMYAPAMALWINSYDTIFGEGTIFLTGILTSSMKPLQDRRRAMRSLLIGIALFCTWAVAIWKSGGYQEPRGHFIRWFFLFMPEILSGTIFLIARGFLSDLPKTAAIASQPLFNALQSLRAIVFRTFVHIGKVSYSGYLFSLFVTTFWFNFCTLIRPGGWLPLIASFSGYLVVLTIFATISYNAIELPFLSMRRKYAQANPDGAKEALEAQVVQMPTAKVK